MFLLKWKWTWKWKQSSSEITCSQSCNYFWPLKHPSFSLVHRHVLHVCSLCPLLFHHSKSYLSQYTLKCTPLTSFLVIQMKRKEMKHERKEREMVCERAYIPIED